MSRLLKILIVVVLCGVLLTGALYWLAPAYIARVAPTYLQQQIGPVLAIGEARFEHHPPRLVLEKIRLKTPPYADANDAIRIDRIVVTFAGYGIAPAVIRTVDVEGVRGAYAKDAATDNFALVMQELMRKKEETPRGFMLGKAVVKQVSFYRTSIQTQDGSVVVPLEDVELAPTGKMTGPVSFQHITTDILGAVVAHQQRSVSYLVTENLREKTRRAVRSVGEAVMDYLSTP